jgi:hypothetical protein
MTSSHVPSSRFPVPCSGSLFPGLACAAIVTALAAIGVRAYEVTLAQRDLEQAFEIAHSTIQSTHLAFHANYRFHVLTPPVDFVEVVTPFRRVVLSAETQLRTGRRMFGQREALAALQPDPDRLEVFVEVTFHPMNTLIGVPEYDVELAPAAARATRVRAGTIDRLPRYGARVDDTSYLFPYPYTLQPRLASGSAPLLGGTLVARFHGDTVDGNAVYEVVVRDGAKELGRTRPIDLSRLR